MCNNRYRHRGPGMGHPFFGNQFGEKEFRIPVNILKNESNYELLVFAPDRNKEDFRINMKSHELTISYDLKNEDADKRKWVRHEFQKTSFERSFLIDETVDTENITAEYINGILRVILPIIPGSEKPAQEIRIS